MRIPVVPSLSTKDAVANKNARMTNVLNEKGKAVIRPGMSQVLDYAGEGAGLIPFRGTLLSIFEDMVYDLDGSGVPLGTPVSLSADLSAVTGTPVSLSYQPWNPDYTYPIGANVSYDGYIWYSLPDGNIGHVPEVGPYWDSLNPPWIGPKASGGTITYDGAYSIHTFTASGTFTVNIAPLTVDYLIVGGGGGRFGGGGGAGGLSYVTSHSIASTGANTVTVGAAGASGGGATNGGGTTFITTVAGGGVGGDASGGNGGNGACGGGGGQIPPSGTTAGGLGSVGYNGGGGSSASSGLYLAGGGGGGMGAAGTDGVTTEGGSSGDHAGSGGDGVLNSITGSAIFYAGGGGGAFNNVATGTHGYGRSGYGGGAGQSGFVYAEANAGIVRIRYLT